MPVRCLGMRLAWQGVARAVCHSSSAIRRFVSMQTCHRRCQGRCSVALWGLARKFSAQPRMRCPLYGAAAAACKLDRRRAAARGVLAGCT